MCLDFGQRAKDLWIEVEQRELADALVDWDSPDTAYVEALRALRSAYYLPVEAMTALRSFFLSEASKGLAGEPSSLRMLPTFVDRRVTGAERGDYYALDLGGTNFRVLRLSLLGDGKVGPVKQAKFAVPQSAKAGTADDLFGFLADSVATFVATEHATLEPPVATTRPHLTRPLSPDPISPVPISPDLFSPNFFSPDPIGLVILGVTLWDSVGLLGTLVGP